jgi:HD superfamily phosphohydrolase
MPLRYSKQIYDNVHGYINITEHEMRLIDTPIFQRLREVKQLGPTYLVFPGATHTRFSHSIGTMFMMDLFAKNTLRDVEVDDDTLQKLRIAALLHDVGHYPFSHTLEEVITHSMHGKSHVEFGTMLIRKLLSEELGTFTYDEINCLIEGDRSNPLSMLLSSAIDADKSDYMLRDSYNTGVPYGQVNISSLLRIMHFEKNRIIFDKDESPVENFLINRYHLYRAVIHHKVVVAVSLMLQRIFEMLVLEGYIESPLDVYNSEDQDKIAGYNDDIVLNAMHKYIASGEKKSLRELIKDFFRRESLELAYSYVSTSMQDVAYGHRGKEITTLIEAPKSMANLSMDSGIEKDWIFPVVLRTLGLIDEEAGIFVRKEGRTIPIIESDALILRMIGTRMLYDARIYTKKGSGGRLRKALRAMQK